MKHEQIKKFIAILGQPLIVSIFSKGSCVDFAFALKALIPKGSVIRSDEIGYVWFYFDGHHYDIKGCSERLKELYLNKLAYEINEEDLRLRLV